MKTVFISYANEAMSYSLRRIGRQARRLGIFDEVILYTPKDLPKYVLDSPLMKYARGGGYWVWKPAIIRETLNRFEEGTVVVYVDAGCSLRRNAEWGRWLGCMETYSSLVFQYGDGDFPEWKKFGSDKAKVLNWTKTYTLEYLKDYCNDNQLETRNELFACISFFRGRNNPLLSRWHDLMFDHPELVIDPPADEPQHPGYARHRHDQSIFTALAVHDSSTLILPETMEHYSPDTPVWASRIRAATWRDYMKIQIKHYLRIWLGDSRFENIKHKLVHK